VPETPAGDEQTNRTLFGNTEQSYTANRPAEDLVSLVGVVTTFDGNLTITGSAGAFDDLEGATQVLISGLGALDGWRTVTVDIEANTITLAAYHSVGTTVYATDEFGAIATDELGAYLTLSEGLVAAGEYTLDLDAVIGTTFAASCSATVPANTYYRECQSSADAYALAKATEEATACIADDPSILYRNSKVSYTANCPANQYGSYTAEVAYNSYTSETSQRDADQKALSAAIVEAITGLTCETDPSACSWSNEVVLLTDGSTFEGTSSSSASLADSELNVSGRIYGTTTSLYNTEEIQRRITFTKSVGVISGTIDFTVSELDEVSGAGFSGFGFSIYEDGVLRESAIRTSDTYGPGSYSIPYSVLSATVDVEIRIGAALYSSNSGGDFTGSVAFTSSITGTPCS
jgi:hypothetical protein